MPSQACSRTTIAPSIPPAKSGTSSAITAAGSSFRPGMNSDDDALVSVRIVLQPGRIGVVAAEDADSLSRSERAADVQRLRLTQRVQPVLADAGPGLFLAASRGSDVVAGLTQHVDLELSNARCNPFGTWDVPHRRLTSSILADRDALQSPDRGHIARPVHSRA